MISTRYIMTLQRFPQAPPPLPSTAKAAQRARRKAQLLKARLQTFLFPVNPEDLQIRMGRETIDVALLRSRTVSRPGNWTPIEVSATGLMIPHRGFTQPGVSWLNVPVDQLADPWAVVLMLRAWQKAEGDATRLSPLRLTIADMTGFMLNVTMTQCDASVRPGEPGPAYVDLTFKEIMDLPELKAKRVSAKPKPSTLTARKGETLVQMVKRHYGKATSALVDKVYKLNKAKVGADRSRRLPEGTKITFPPK